MSTRSRFVRVRFDFVLDMGRDLSGLPHELESLSHISKFVEGGLVFCLASHLRQHITFVAGQSKVTLFRPRLKKMPKKTTKNKRRKPS